MAENKRIAAIRYASKFIGTQYIWGGDDPVGGFDCSGLICEILQSVGILPHGTRLSAANLFERFKEKNVDRPRRGVLVFYRRDAIIRHVEIMEDTLFSVGASGGDSTTDETADAIARNAFVKMRPLGYYSSDYYLVDPFL